MRGVAALRIVHAIRKPRNKADGAIAPKPGWDGAFRAICFVASLAHGSLPWASRRFAQLIPESLRSGHAGLVQRFPESEALNPMRSGAVVMAGRVRTELRSPPVDVPQHGDPYRDV